MVEMIKDDLQIKKDILANVTLKGAVPGWPAYREAYSTALHTVGVTGIFDHLTVDMAG